MFSGNQSHEKDVAVAPQEAPMAFQRSISECSPHICLYLSPPDQLQSPKLDPQPLWYGKYTFECLLLQLSWIVKGEHIVARVQYNLGLSNWHLNEEICSSHNLVYVCQSGELDLVNTQGD